MLRADEDIAIDVRSDRKSVVNNEDRGGVDKDEVVILFRLLNQFDEAFGFIYLARERGFGAWGKDVEVAFFEMLDGILEGGVAFADIDHTDGVMQVKELMDGWSS